MFFKYVGIYLEKWNEFCCICLKYMVEWVNFEWVNFGYKLENLIIFLFL